MAEPVRVFPKGMKTPRETFDIPDENAMRELGAACGRRWKSGDIVWLSGNLGAGKTTFVRGLLEGLGHQGYVRSPTFNLIQTFATIPPVMHADLYRVESAEGMGLEDHFDTHLCLIEWPDRLGALIDAEFCWRVAIAFTEAGRRVEIVPPDGPSE